MTIQVLPQTPRALIEVSDSQIKVYKRCPRLWAYTKLLKLECIEDRDNLILGSCVHAGLEALHGGASIGDAKVRVAEQMVKEKSTDRDLLAISSAMVEGYARHFLPSFQRQWKTIGVEEWFEYHVGVVKIRGKKDHRSCSISDPNHVCLRDHKTSGSRDGGELGKTIETNVQLALYSLSHYRQYGAWPTSVGLDFLQKPKLQTTEAIVERCLTDASLYSDRIVPFTPAMAVYAISVEQQIVLWANQMFAIQQAFDMHGPAVLDHVPANLDECVYYGTQCGFTAGCHSCQPAHSHFLRRS